jgi:hypothetical protein
MVGLPESAMAVGNEFKVSGVPTEQIPIERLNTCDK